MVSITRERTLLKEVGLADYRLREDWGARRSYTDSNPVDEPATRVFVHITVTNPGNYSSFDAHARAIEAIGISRFPNTGISYNRLIQAGTLLVYEGQPIGRRGAHTVNDKEISPCSWFGRQCPGYNHSLTAPNWNLNYNSRAYVYCANTFHSFDDNSLDTMARAIAADKMAGFVTNGAAIHGHRCVAWKSCPGDNVWARMHELEGLVTAYMEGGVSMALDRDQTTDAVWNNDGIVANASRAHDLDTNPHVYASTHLRRIVNSVVYPRASDDLIKLIKDPILAKIDAIEIPQPKDYTADLEEIKQQNVELQDQVAYLQATVNLLVEAQYLSWEELGDTTWSELNSWNSLGKSMESTAMKASAKEGAQEALSNVNLEVSWE